MADDDEPGARSSPDGPEGEAHLSLSRAVGVLGEPTRADILVALGEAGGGVAPDPVPFSALKERVGVEDSGRFNYHLGELAGTFVERSDDGYRLRLPGRRVYQAIVAGTLTERPAVEPFEVGECPECGGALAAAYHPEHLLTVECGGCERLFDAVHLPARALESHAREDLLEVAYARRHHELATMRRGACAGCGGRVERALYHAEDAPEGVPCEDGPRAVLACDACGASLVGHPANVALTAPCVVGFFAAHGRDAATARWWTDPVAAARAGTNLVRTDPPAVAVTFECGGGTLTVELDDDLAVAAVDRSAR